MFSVGVVGSTPGGRFSGSGTPLGPSDLPKTSRDIDIAITDTAGGGRASARDHFVPGEQ